MLAMPEHRAIGRFLGRTPMALLVAVSIITASLALSSLRAGDDVDVSYEHDIEPIFSARCFKCHGGVKRRGDLSLLTRQAATAPTESGKPAIAPGEPDESELIRLVSIGDEDDDADEKMPPRGDRLTAEEIDKLRRWIAAGAQYTGHWSLQPITLPEPPPAREDTNANDGIDRFVRTRLAKGGLQANGDADPYTLIRRVSLDLTGLPPTLAEAEAFAADPSTQAWEAVVDRLLESPHYGERWAHMWLDMARYADTQGYEKDSRRTIWRFRDWVVDAFNRDLPYDRFTIEQIAGDLLPEPTTDQLIATAFHRNTMTNTEGGTDDEEYRVAAVMDRVATTWQVWMGTTFGCVQCHSHPYDPFTHEEYYRFYAFFNQTADRDQPNEHPTAPTPTASDLEEKKRREEAVATARAELERADDASRAAAKKRLDEAEKRLKSFRPTTTPVLRELPADKQRTTHIFVRGSFLAPGDEVTAGVPESLHAFPKDAPQNRLGVAQWIVDPQNPLTARVAVNRFWEHLFGTGLVETPTDFGTQGGMPSHPELLDWLAHRFVHMHGWSVKKLLREIVLSATYRRSSRATPESIERDPLNRLLARGPRFRAEAEMIRDQALAVSGLLSRKLGGPSVMPAQPEGVWQVVYSGDRWKTSAGEDRHRRALYTFWRRTSPYPSMVAFDATSREYCAVSRVRTNTPLQALVTLNDPVYVEAAQALARRVLAETGNDHDRDARIRLAFRLALLRPPRDAETARLAALLDNERAHYRSDRKQAERVATAPIGPAPEGVDIAELAAWTVVCNVILNLDEFLTKG